MKTLRTSAESEHRQHVAQSGLQAANLAFFSSPTLSPPQSRSLTPMLQFVKQSFRGELSVLYVLLAHQPVTGEHELHPLNACCCLVAQSCLTFLRPRGLAPGRLLCPMGFPRQGVLEWAVISSSRGSS